MRRGLEINLVVIVVVVVIVVGVLSISQSDRL